MSSFEISTLDIAKFFYIQDISNKKRSKILVELWKNRNKYLEYYMYSNLRMFSNEVNNLLADLCFDNIIFEETEEVVTIQKDINSSYIGYGLYKINKNKMESFLKQCKLRILYGTNNDYVYMKMRTLTKECGYKRRSLKFENDLRDNLLNLELYISDGINKFVCQDRDVYERILDIKMDDYIRIYSY